MKPGRAALLVVMIGLIAFAGDTFARGGHSGGRHSGGGHHFGGSHARTGVFLGAPALFYFPPPFYYSPPAPPPVYIEQAPGGPPDAAAGNWYYCAGTQAYFPYVNECPGGWQLVAPQPSPGP